MTRSRIGAGGAALLIVALSVLVSPGPAVGATTSLTAQSTYDCQASTAGSANANYKVTMRMQLDAPDAVQPGQKVDLAGVLTMQFDESLYNNAHLIGVSEVDGYSTTLSTTTLINGKKSVVFANRWQTSPAPLRDPIVVTAPITFPSFTVPSNASGTVELGLPQNETVPNSVSSSPATVAFNAVANAKTSSGSLQLKLACYLSGTAPGVLGRIPVSATPSAGQQQPAAAASGKPGVGLPASTPVAPGAPAAQVPAPAPGAAVQPGAVAASPTGSGVASSAAGDSPSATLASQPTAPTTAGVYVPTGLLVFGGAAVCLASLAYAGLTNYRLRMIRRAMEG